MSPGRGNEKEAARQRHNDPDQDHRRAPSRDVWRAPFVGDQDAPGRQQISGNQQDRRDGVRIDCHQLYQMIDAPTMPSTATIRTMAIKAKAGTHGYNPP